MSELLELIGGGPLASGNRMDDLSLAIIERLPLLKPDLEHRFTPGLYARTLRAPAGAIATTYIHKQTHQFVVTKGIVMVRGVGDEWVSVEAPYFGITEAGTERVCLVVEDAEWTTFHPIPEGLGDEDLEQIESLLFECRLLPDGTTVAERFSAALDRQIATREKRELQP